MHRRVVQIALAIALPMMMVWGLWHVPAWALTEEQKILSESWRIVNRAYLDETFNGQNWWFVREQAIRKPLKSREETYEAIEEMLAGLDDPFTRLLKPEQYRSLQVSTSGELTGVGLQIAKDPDNGELMVVTPLDGSPADAAGIQPRDRILKIDGFPTPDLTLDEAAARMRGTVGTPVVLTVKSAESDIIEDLKLLRDRITLNPVFAQLQTFPDRPPVGYIRLRQFSANATAEVAHAIVSLQNEGATAFLLDLRNNPGGLLQAGVEIARLWIDEGAIVYTVNRQGILGGFDATGSALTDAPLVVLVNGGSASASEILAGALQDNGRALLVGEKTFGKGLIQSLFDLSDGAGLAVTVAKYETPNHTDINKHGIVPDRVVSADHLLRSQLGTDADLQYQAAIDVLLSQTVLAEAG
ncbi:carboxyl-terminal processing protease CtpA [Lyngbya sp. CCY1209]|uniref:carboxyl-terminal processing protease CtpA n=1 Tax=Lyngbya sp. CCY1209 TaxID=2886103 RepID=UPI002D201030|nr:carboxyl-terminal processing protease CtpA [Lyngbya sp. CCY1209]MEB3885804.1 PDZ domain-containing protein [Lyngbya sp. CCY1209]